MVEKIQETSLVSGAKISTAGLRMPQANAAKSLAATTGVIADTVLKMQNNVDNLNMSSFEQWVSDHERTLISNASEMNTIDQVDDLYETFKIDMDAQAKEKLGPRLYDKWSKTSKGDYVRSLDETLNRTKAPILQKLQQVALGDLLQNTAHERASAITPQAKKESDALVNQALLHAVDPGQGGIPYMSVEEANNALKRYNNMSEISEIRKNGAVYADGVLKNLKAGKYSTLTADQIKSETAYLERQRNVQQQDSLYEHSLGRATDKTSGKTDYVKALEYVNNQAEKDFTDLDQRNVEAVSDMLIAKIAHNDKVRIAGKRQREEDAVNKSHDLASKGMYSEAIQTVYDSPLDGTTQYELINKFKRDAKNITTLEIRNPLVYSDIVTGIVNGDITDNHDISIAFARQQITESDRKNLMSLLEDVKSPANELLKTSMSQVDDALKTPLFSSSALDLTMLTDKAGLKAYIKNKLTAEYRNALKDKKTQEELEVMFGPVRINAMIEQAGATYKQDKNLYQQTEKLKSDMKVVQDQYQKLYDDVSKGKIRKEEDLLELINIIEETNSVYNSFEVQEQLIELVNEGGGPQLVAGPDNETFLVSERYQEQAYKIGQPTLRLNTIEGETVAQPNMSISQYVQQIVKQRGTKNAK